MTVSEQLRNAIENSGLSRYRISQDTGVPASVLSRFVAGGHGMRSENIDTLCKYFGLELKKRSSRKRN
ncbi:MAG: helix-turn-helix transcriptional regulator [Phycisphaeraceae bacterium]|nr:helix-turn-helix transcriptional regulator [Phycisphaerales bacterium]MCB9860848.1 helix-turn-helix transcriptional regulator [Phycisphaeraceae bacterium]